MVDAPVYDPINKAQKLFSVPFIFDLQNGSQYRQTLLDNRTSPFNTSSPK